MRLVVVRADNGCYVQLFCAHPVHIYNGVGENEWHQQVQGGLAKQGKRKGGQADTLHNVIVQIEECLTCTGAAD